MNDPILKSIQGAIVSMHFSDPATAVKLGRLNLQPSMDIGTAFKVDDDVLHYSAQHVKNLTMDELKEALANVVVM